MKILEKPWIYFHEKLLEFKIGPQRTQWILERTFGLPKTFNRLKNEHLRGNTSKIKILPNVTYTPFVPPD